MKKSILGSLVGIAIVVTLDSFARVAISLYTTQDILMFAYSSFPGPIWPILLTLIAGVSSFLGGIFSLTYSKSHQAVAAALFVFFIILLRYGQLHLLIDRETLFFPITALILSLGGVFLAWQLAKSKQGVTDESTYHYPSDEQD